MGTAKYIAKRNLETSVPLHHEYTSKRAEGQIHEYAKSKNVGFAFELDIRNHHAFKGRQSEWLANYNSGNADTRHLDGRCSTCVFALMFRFITK